MTGRTRPESCNHILESIETRIWANRDPQDEGLNFGYTLLRIVNNL